MTFLEILDTLFLGPLKLLFEIIFKLAITATGNAGVAIIILSLIMNLLILPLYMCADAMQERARLREEELAPSVKHIKKTFNGDERMMMLNTFYKQNHYSPLSALSGAVSLLLEIPFFIAAYTFLSDVAVFQGASFLFIPDLSKADALIKIGSISINVLPFVMTLFNIIASVLFLKGAPLKSKIQLYAMALFFLIFLYTSPSGLLFYWTLNNLFSLIKNIFYKFKQPRVVLAGVISVIGVAIPITFFAITFGSIELRLGSIALGLAMQAPLVIHLLKKKEIIKPKALSNKAIQPNKKLFFFSCGFIAVLLGLLIPSNYVASSPTEFYNPSAGVNPLWYIMSSACLSIGTFLIWFSVFYWLASPKGKVIFEKVAFVLAIAMFVNYMFFGKQLGNISSALQYDNGVNFSTLETVINILVVLIIVVTLYFVTTKLKFLFKSAILYLLAISISAVGVMSSINMVSASAEINALDVSTLAKKELPSFNLTKQGKNVIVIMLDRAVGEFIPYMLKESAMRKANGLDEKSLEEIYSGFTYYSNVISFGEYTNFTTPSLLGGYEYTPVELNARNALSLKEKQNESLLVLPRIFTENAWTNGEYAKATVFDPPYANYQWVSDLSVYDEYKDKVTAKNVIGKYTDEKQNRAIARNNLRNFYCFSLMKTLPLFSQTLLYNDGLYNNVYSVSEGEAYSIQTTDGISKANGVRATFMDNYNNLLHLNDMTKVLKDDEVANTKSTDNTFTFMLNNATHEPMLLDEANNYTVPKHDKAKGYALDNTQYDQKYQERFILDDGIDPTKTLNVNDVSTMQHYQTNMASLLRIGEWLEYLKEIGVYDNTRIIIASDHGTELGNLNQMDFGVSFNGGYYFPLLLVKDFGASGDLQTDHTFMTNADLPTLATEGVIANPTNPFTGKAINNAEKTAHPQYIIRSAEWSIYLNNGRQFKSAKWASIDSTKSDVNIWNTSCWDFLEEEVVLTEHSFNLYKK